MIEARMARGRVAWTWSAPAVVTIAVASIGCTMCPDPFDYSGPVPNGSSPQNDFRARSNGILPLGAAPRPWPPIVEKDTAPAVMPEVDDPAPVIADAGGAVESSPDGLRQTVAVLPDVCDVPSEPDDDPKATNEPAPQGSVQPMPNAGGHPSPVVPSVTTFQSGETPGWRTRRR